MAERAAFHESLTDINVYRRVKAGIVDGSLVYPGEIVYTDEDVALLEVNPLINPLHTLYPCIETLSKQCTIMPH